jgi:glutathione S-transferase
MIKLYHAPFSRSDRIHWLLEELELPYELVSVEFVRPTTVFSQATPSGKLPVIEDGDLIVSESGAIIEYVIERYGRGRLAPPVGSSLRPAYLQWIHFAEATVMAPLGELIRQTRFYPEDRRVPFVMDDVRMRAAAAVDVIERALIGKEYLAGEFSGADIMMGYSLAWAKFFEIFPDPERPNVSAYYERLRARPANRKLFGSRP